MDYENFKAELMEDIRRHLYESGTEAVLSERQVDKPNESYMALTAMPEGKDVGVNINIDRYYDQYEKGRPFSDIVDSVVDNIEYGFENSIELNPSELVNYDQMKKRLSMEVISLAGNEDYLANIPHHEIEDMAVIYRFVVEREDYSLASIVVTNEQLKLYGITEEELHADALINAPKIRPAVIQRMTDVINEMTGTDEMEFIPQDIDDMMYVASVPDRVQGASVLAYQDFMDQAAQRLEGDFFILPSSIHEIILVKDDGDINFRKLEEMVQEVNATQVQPEEKLTDSVYHYDSEAHIFELASRFEERMQEKELAAEERDTAVEKGSLIAGLREKSAEAAQIPRKEKNCTAKAMEGAVL